jgi:hypothetical protein
MGREEGENMIIPLDFLDVCDKIQHPFMIKILKRICLETIYTNTMKSVYNKPHLSL